MTEENKKENHLDQEENIKEDLGDQEGGANDESREDEGNGEGGGSDKDREVNEALARRMGWKPKDEYKGTEEWVDADQFLAKSENDPVEMRKAVRSMNRNFERLEKSIDAMKNHQERELKRTREEAYKKAFDDLDNTIEEALESGNKELVKKAMKARDQLKEDKAKEDRSSKGVDDYEAQTILSDWKAENKWFETDERMTTYAKAYADTLAQKGITDPEKQLKMVSDEMKEAFPHKFGSNKKPAPAMVNGENNKSSIGKGKPKPGTYESLTPEAKVECDRNVKLGISKEDFLAYCDEDMFIK